MTCDKVDVIADMLAHRGARITQTQSSELSGFNKAKYTEVQWCWCKNYEKRTGFDPMMDDFEAGNNSFYESARFSIDWFEDHASDAMLSIGANVPGDPIYED